MNIKNILLGLCLTSLSFAVLANCPDVIVYCYSYELDKINPIPNTATHFQSGSKWDWRSIACKPVESKNQYLQECMRRDKNLHAMAYPHDAFKVSPKYSYVNYSWPGFSTENWMKGLKNRYPAFANAAIKEIVLPGTHDSGTYKINQKSSYSPDEPYGSEFLDFIKHFDLAHLIFVKWSKTQPNSIKQQLDNGIRYFDLRVCGHNNTNYICHGKYSDQLSNVIDQIKRFIDNPDHGNEIILLDFNHFYNVNTTAHHVLISELIEKLGPRIADRDNYSANTKLKEFWHDNKQVIILYNHNESLAQYSQLWPISSINSPWPNRQKINDLINDLNKNLAKHHGEDGFYVIQTQLSANLSTIKESIYKPYLPQSIQDNTLNYKQKVYDWLYANKSKIAEFGSIIIEDWSTGKALTHYAITANGEKYWKQ